MSESLVIDDLEFEIRRSARRKTVSVTVDRSGKLVLSAPGDCPKDFVERIAKQKRFWIYTKLAEKERLVRPASKKEFVSGEGFYYLGRNYRLLLVNPTASDAPMPSLLFQHGRFLLRRDESQRGREHFIKWYTRRAKSWLRRKADLLSVRLDVNAHKVHVRELGYRWGSCGRGGTVNFHWRTIMLPPCICEYIVAHELVHLREPRHTAQFWSRLERAMPDYASRKQWLRENGSQFVL